MVQVTLTDEQVKLLQSAGDGAELRDSTGRIVGYVRRPSQERIEEARRRLANREGWQTTEELLSKLRGRGMQ